MPFLVRPLFGRIDLTRPDLEPAKIAVAVQAAVRDVCRDTMLARQTLQYTITANTNSVGVTLTNQNLIMVHSVIYQSSTDTEWSTLEPVSFEEAERTELWKLTGQPNRFSQQGDTIIIYPKPTIDGTLRVALSYAPTTDVDTAPLPENAVQAVCARAESWLLRNPGPGASMAAAGMREQDYRRLMSELRAISLFGESGDVELVNPYGPVV